MGWEQPVVGNGNGEGWARGVSVQGNKESGFEMQDEKGNSAFSSWVTSLHSEILTDSG